MQRKTIVPNGCFYLLSVYRKEFSLYIMFVVARFTWRINPPWCMCVCMHVCIRMNEWTNEWMNEHVYVSTLANRLLTYNGNLHCFESDDEWPLELAGWLISMSSCIFVVGICIACSCPGLKYSCKCIFSAGITDRTTGDRWRGPDGCYGRSWW